MMTTLVATSTAITVICPRPSGYTDPDVLRSRAGQHIASELFIIGGVGMAMIMGAAIVGLMVAGWRIQAFLKKMRETPDKDWRAILVQHEKDRREVKFWC
jgi:hypothetical protein